MSNKITFLGTGGGRIIIAHQLRATGGVILNLEDTQIHIDPGPGSLVQAKEHNLDPTKTDLVLVFGTYFPKLGAYSLVSYQKSPTR